ncbi:MAG TPA: hypothetical protein PLD59_14745 [Tepidisphaeraceae bacterium]|nr:hypothetical protein [Tepidisphaeraceae bacterium]
MNDLPHAAPHEVTPAQPGPVISLAPLTSGDVWKRVGVWTAVCGIASVPSFVFAWPEADRGAMLVGVLLFIGAYVAVSCAPFVRRLYRKPFMKTSIFIGYGLRMAATAVFPYAWIGDLLPGMMAVGLTDALFGIDWKQFNEESAQAFVATLFTTIVQGLLLNIIVGTAVAIIYFAQRLFRKNPDAIQPRGFEVLPTASQALSSGSPEASNGPTGSAAAPRG